MSISDSSWTGNLFSTLSAVGFTGPDLITFCTAVGQGSAKATINKPYMTSSTGTGSSSGVVGITGVAPTIYSTSASLMGSAGPNLMDFCIAVELALIMEMSKATLKLGGGAIIAGSIAVDGDEWGSQIEKAGRSMSFSGMDWPNFSKAIGIGCAEGFKTATGSLSAGDSGPTAGMIS